MWVLEYFTQNKYNKYYCISPKEQLLYITLNVGFRISFSN